MFEESKNKAKKNSESKNSDFWKNVTDFYHKLIQKKTI